MFADVTTPAVCVVTADIGVNFSGVVGDSGVSETALRTSNVSVNQCWDADKVRTAAYSEIQHPLIKLV